MAKIKIKSKKKTEKEPPFDMGETLGTMEQMKSKEHLEKVRSKHRKGGTLDNYCDMLETQINSLVEKILSITEQPVPKVSKSDADKHIKKLREHINSAQNQLNMAQIYARDNIDN